MQMRLGRAENNQKLLTLKYYKTTTFLYFFSLTKNRNTFSQQPLQLYKIKSRI